MGLDGKSCITINCGCCETESMRNEEYFDLTKIDSGAQGGLLRIGKCVIMICSYMGSIDSGKVIFTLPEGYRPKETVNAVKVIGSPDRTEHVNITINTDGTIISNSIVNRTFFDLNFMYEII